MWGQGTAVLAKECCAGAVFAARCKSLPSPLLAPLQAMIKGDKRAAAAAGSNVLEVGGTHLAVPDF